MTDPMLPHQVATYDQMLAQAHTALHDLVTAYSDGVDAMGDLHAVAALTLQLTRLSPGTLLSIVVDAVTRMHSNQASPA